ncbi:hypothetical protein ABZZ47_29850 [Streptomyces sp. NPDC006465]|uniref:hypothetical protein n=1 Tax=Streptomyces sp. NPDC006465 TaxID=3157174 RepID=UPI0033AC44E3
MAGSRASLGVRVVDTERILEGDAVFTSSVMRTKQTVKPPAARLSRHPGIHLAVQRRGAGVVRRDRRDGPVTAKPVRLVINTVDAPPSARTIDEGELQPGSA